MEQLILIGSNIIFILIGWFFGRYTHDPEIKKKVLEKTKKTLVKAGIIEYPSQADIDYRESGEEKVDEAREKVFREQFKV